MEAKLAGGEGKWGTHLAGLGEGEELSPPPKRVLAFVTQKETEVQSGVTG